MNFIGYIKRLKNQVDQSLRKIKGIPLYVIITLPFLLNVLVTVALIENRNVSTLQIQDNDFDQTSDRLPTVVEAASNKLKVHYLFYLLPITLAGIATSIGIILAIQGKNPPQTEIANSDDNESTNPQDLKQISELPNHQAISQIVPIDRKIDNSYSWLADMGHELRSPLNAILGFVQIMQQELPMTQSQANNLTIINRSGLRLLAIINDLVDLSKIKTNCFSLENNSFNFNLWLDSIEKHLSFQLNNQEKEFHLNLIRDQNLPHYICIDERRLRQILKNLINLCLKNTSAPELTVRVGCCNSSLYQLSTTSTSQPESSVKHNIYFEIENQNCSLTAEEINTLFDPTVKIRHEQQITESSSLSLPISRQLAQLMGGNITVRHSDRDELNIIFRLDIQTENVVAKQLEVQSACKRIIGLESEEIEYRILIVDDSKTNRKIMLHLLEPVGFKVKEAVNGKEAVDIWLDWQPHMIWMDLKMPVMNGYEATEQIKSYAHQNIPIVALTASTIEEERRLFLAAGCDDFVGKPFSHEIIFDKIAQHLGIRYVYESTDFSTLSNEQNFKLTAEALKIMPNSWLTQVEAAADRLDRDLLTELLEHIPPEHNQLKNALQKQVDNFDFDRIFTLVKSK
jgi:signal transduction histidine kinase/DNA-binding response OmpR family regulator